MRLREEPDEDEKRTPTPELANYSDLGAEWRLLFYQSFDVFREASSLRNDPNIDNTDLRRRIKSISHRYSALLEESHEIAIQQDRSQTIWSLRVLWKLFQIVFLDSGTAFGKTDSTEYVDRLAALQELLGAPLKAMPSTAEKPRSSSATWRTIARFILLGQLSEAVASMEHLSLSTQSREIVQEFANLLLTVKVIPTTVGGRLEKMRVVNEFLKSDGLEEYPEIKQIAQLMLGDFEYWAVVGHEFTSWFAFFVMRAKVLGLCMSPYELAQERKLFADARLGCQEPLVDDELDKIVESVLLLNWDDAFESLRKWHRNTWFATHMWDLLDLSGVLTDANQSMESSRNSRVSSIPRIPKPVSATILEGLLTEYAATGIQSGLWLPFIRYLNFCPNNGPMLLERFLTAPEALATLEQRHEVIAVLNADGMNEAVKIIFRKEAWNAAQCGDFESALDAASQCDENDRCQIGKKYLEALRRSRGSLEFRSGDRVVMRLLPDPILRRLGAPGLQILYESAMQQSRYQDAIAHAAVILQRTFERERLYQTLTVVNECFQALRSGNEAVSPETYRKLREWAMNLPLTNLQPRSQPEREAVFALEKEIFKSPAWCMDQYSQYAISLKS